MRGELPSQEQTTCSGNSRCSSVCLLARIEWNNRGQPETPARRSRPSPCWLRRDTAVQRPRIHSCPQRSRTLRQESDAARERSDNCESLGLRDARPSAPGYSSGSFPNRCRPIVARMFPMVCEAHRSDSGPRSLAKRGWLFSPDSLPANFSHKIIRL
jgi:hypothetical protein